MAIEFKLPQVSEGVTEADVAEVSVSEGDDVKSGQVVLVVETDKAAADIECPHAGRVAKVHVKPGDSVAIGATLLTIEPSGDGEAAKPAAKKEAAAKPAKPEKPAPRAAETAAEKPAPRPVARAEKPGARPIEEQEPFVKPTQPPAPPGSPKPAGRAIDRAQPEDVAVARAPSEQGGQADGAPAPAAPSTRRLARELGVDLKRITGTGPGGRITTEDVQAFVRQLSSGSAPQSTALSVAGPMAAPQLPDFNKFGALERVGMSKLAKTAAANLSLAWQVIPHVTQHDLADVTELEESRKQYMEKVGKNGPKITMTAIMIKAAVAALKAFPHFNSSLDLGSGEIILKKYYNIGIAVDTEYGLLVPVIRDADRKSVLECAAELAEISERARSRKLDLADMQGGTFTITNLGGIGGTSFTPIVNYPEVAILGMSRTRWQLELIDGKPVPRLLLPLSLSYDHRVINGADAARFVARLVASLSDFFQMLIEG